MAFEKVSVILKGVDINKTAVIAFNCHNYESIAWPVDVGNELGIPVIISLPPYMEKYIPFEVFSAITKTLAEKVKVPIGLHLDHCDSFDTILRAIKAGFISVMIDGSRLPYEQNIRATCEIVKVAHALGVDVEAELGRVGMAANPSDYKNLDNYTTPEQAVDFIDKTKIDSLAIAIGSAHGYYVEAPKLDINRLKEINKAVDTPLVLHGGTGIPNEQLIQAFKHGINKLNIGTEYHSIFYSTAMDYQQIKNKKDDLLALCDYQKQVIKNYLRHKLSLTIPGVKS